MPRPKCVLVNASVEHASDLSCAGAEPARAGVGRAASYVGLATPGRTVNETRNRDERPSPEDVVGGRLAPVTGLRPIGAPAEGVAGEPAADSAEWDSYPPGNHITPRDYVAKWMNVYAGSCSTPRCPTRSATASPARLLSPATRSTRSSPTTDADGQFPSRRLRSTCRNSMTPPRLSGLGPHDPGRNARLRHHRRGDCAGHAVGWASPSKPTSGCASRTAITAPCSSASANTFPPASKSPSPVRPVAAALPTSTSSPHQQFGLPPWWKPSTRDAQGRSGFGQRPATRHGNLNSFAAAVTEAGAARVTC